jgi:hypothetical protein
MSGHSRNSFKEAELSEVAVDWKFRSTARSNALMNRLIEHFIVLTS